MLGIEGDFEGSGVHRISHCLVEANIPQNSAPGNCFPFSYYNSMDSRWEGSIRPRLGYAVGKSLF